MSSLFPESDEPDSLSLPALYNSLKLFQYLDAYRLRLQTAQKETGELRLQVLRNILRRLVAFQQEIDGDLAEKYAQLEALHRQYIAPDTEDPEMAGQVALFLAKLDRLRSQWEDTVAEQHAENLLRLEEVLIDREHDA